MGEKTDSTTVNNKYNGWWTTMTKLTVLQCLELLLW